LRITLDSTRHDLAHVVSDFVYRNKIEIKNEELQTRLQQEELIPYNTLLYGNTRSCGCKKRESDQKLSGRVSRVAGTSIDHLKSKKIPTNNTTGVKGVYQDKHG